MDKILFVSSKKWFFLNKDIKKLIKKKNIYKITDKKKLNLKNISKINPTKIFFPHWSYRVPDKILKKFECICFHTAPLPYGRGGSPIQNLIIRKFKKAPVCAIKMTNKIDSGPIYSKKNISLNGSLNEIFERISNAILFMITKIIKNKIITKHQSGKPLYFKRINEQESIINQFEKLDSVYDKIRMLDSDEYPNAYYKFGNTIIKLQGAKTKKNYILCNAKIFKTK
jgi:methionyl-tRNA formyltransferase